MNKDSITLKNNIIGASTEYILMPLSRIGNDNW